MLVHSFGYPAKMDEIMKIAKKYKLRVIEDAAPALGAEFDNKRLVLLEILDASVFKVRN